MGEITSRGGGGIVMTGAGVRDCDVRVGVDRPGSASGGSPVCGRGPRPSLPGGRAGLIGRVLVGGETGPLTGTGAGVGRKIVPPGVPLGGTATARGGCAGLTRR